MKLLKSILLSKNGECRMIKIIICILVSLLCVTGCQNNVSKNNDSNEIESIFIEKKDNCDNDLELYYKDSMGIKYYGVCLSKIKLIYSDKEVELKDVIKQDSKILDEVINKLKLSDVLYDGGTKIYKTPSYSNFVNSNNGFTVIKCNAMHNETLEDGTMIVNSNNDYYFGNSSLEFKDGYCINN